MSGRISNKMVTDGLVFYIDAANPRSYPITGTTVYDLIGTNNVILTSGASVSNGVLVFNGVNNYITASDNDNISFTSGGGNDTPFSISLWARFISFSSIGNFLLEKRPTIGAGGEWELITYPNKISFFKFSNTNTEYQSILQINTLNLNTWYNIVYTDNGSKTNIGMKIYLNGIIEPTTNVNLGSYTGMTNTTNPLTIGYHPSSPVGTYHNGSLSLLMVYRKELTSAEVLQNFNATRKKFGL